MNYVEEAQRNIYELYMKNTDRRNDAKITTSKIRGLLSGMSDIYNDVIQLESDTLPAGVISRIMYLKVQFIYASGRDPKVKNFIEKTGLLNRIDAIGSSREAFKETERYMEALVAYHRYYGGRDE